MTWLILVADGLHNLLGGLSIGAVFVADVRLGIMAWFAAAAHEVPQELGDFGVLVHSGLGVRKAVLVNFASASLAIAGAILALLVGGVAGSAVVAVMLPITAGGFVYIAAADLIPELQHDHSARGLLVQASFIAAGIAIMATLTLLEGAST